jgi:DNA-binding transcriptional ArsR family regulator
MTVSLFEVVVEPHRRVILDALRERDRSVGDLVELLQLAQPTVSKHLKALREAGLVTVRPEAQRRWYQLRSEPLKELDAWLEPYRHTWAGRLDDLGRHLDAQAARDSVREADREADRAAASKTAGRSAVDDT